MTEALEVPSKDGLLKVKFEWNATLGSKIYTRAASPGEGEVYQPLLDVKLSNNSGTFDEQPTVIELPFGDAFTVFVGVGDALPPIDVTITEITSTLGVTADDTTLVLFKGRVSKTVRNPEGKQSVIRIEALSMKGILDVPLGIVCTQQCAWTFGGSICQVNLVPLLQTGTCTAIGTDRKVTITDVLPHNDALRDREFRNGYVERNSLRIPIRAWDVGDPHTFILRDKPPAEWIGQEVIVTPGCGKSIEDCRGWDNELNFGGLGIGMPDYMPVIEG